MSFDWQEHIADPFLEGREDFYLRNGTRHSPLGLRIRYWKTHTAPASGNFWHPGIFHPEHNRDWQQRRSAARKNHKLALKPINDLKFQQEAAKDKADADFKVSFATSKARAAQARPEAIQEIRQQILAKMGTEFGAIFGSTPPNYTGPHTPWEEAQEKKALKDYEASTKKLRRGYKSWLAKITLGNGEVDRRTNVKRDFYRAALEVTKAQQEVAELALQQKRDVLEHQYETGLISKSYYQQEDRFLEQQLVRLREQNKLDFRQQKDATKNSIKHARIEVMDEIAKELLEDYNVTLSVITKVRIDPRLPNAKEQNNKLSRILKNRAKALHELRVGRGAIGANAKKKTIAEEWVIQRVEDSKDKSNLALKHAHQSKKADAKRDRARTRTAIRAEIRDAFRATANNVGRVCAPLAAKLAEGRYHLSAAYHGSVKIVRKDAPILGHAIKAGTAKGWAAAKRRYAAWKMRLAP